MSVTTNLVVRWCVRSVAAAILAMGALPKFTGGAEALAAALPGGGATVLAIGTAEVVAIVLLLVPRLALLGATLATLLMLGAVASHLVGPVGLAGEVAGMFVMALIAAVAAATATLLELARMGCADCGSHAAHGDATPAGGGAA